MTWIEKRVAAALFGTPPTATYEEALQHFETAGMFFFVSIAMGLESSQKMVIALFRKH